MVIEAHVSELGASFGDAGAGAENVGDEFVGCDIVFTFDLVEINGIIGKTEAGDAETLVVGGVIIERIIIATSIWYDIGDADDGVVVFEGGKGLKMEWEIVGCDSDGFIVGIVEIKIATEIGVFSLINGRCTHGISLIIFY